MKIEIGKTYKRRNGKISKCIRIEFDDTAIFDNGQALWSKSGTCWTINSSAFRETDEDIISEVLNSPIQEVTTRKIVAGQYGNLAVGNIRKDGKLGVALQGDKEPGWYVNLTADELETTAATLIEIAKFMKESK